MLFGQIGDMQFFFVQAFVLSSCLTPIFAYYDYAAAYGSPYVQTSEINSANGYDPNWLQSLQTLVQQAWEASQGGSSPSYSYNNGGDNLAQVYGMRDDEMERFLA
uniref:Uncharacterized protein n=1 Tax=Trichuris muris TaxID=70415 RepID=A0A5S6QYT6_TRIMR